jgi:hypothetical protein
MQRLISRMSWILLDKVDSRMDSTKGISLLVQMPSYDSRLFTRAVADYQILKEQFKTHFRNVSRIMDCVGCDKCRLWGKLQVSGFGTALKILFELDEKALE